MSSRRKSLPPYTKFKAWMVENDVKQRDLAKILNLSISAISDRLNGKTDFTMEQVREICNYYKISSDVYFVNHRVS